MLMFPAMIPFVLALLACVWFITIFPIGVVFTASHAMSQHNVCTSYESHDSNSNFHTSSRSCSSISYIDADKSAELLGIWIVGCVMSGMCQINPTKS